MSQVINQPPVSRSGLVKKLVRVLFGLSVTLNVGLIAYTQIPKALPDGSGGGQFARSPDGKYEASASSRQDTNSSSVYYVFTIKVAGGQSIKQVRLDAMETGDSCYFRRLPSIIQWSPDSKEAAFSIPGIQLKMDGELHQDSAVPPNCRSSGE